MTGEIDKDWYCSARGADGTTHPDCEYDYCRRMPEFHSCKFLHRKHPTPAQFKEEYGFEWDGGFPVYGLQEEITYNNGEEELYRHWIPFQFYDEIKPMLKNPNSWYKCVVCACTPFGIPPDDWRPE